VHCISEPDRGQAHAVNKGIEAARGEIICWLNADDQYAPGAFAKLREAFAGPGVDVVYGNALERYFDGRPGGERPARFGRRQDFLIWWEKRTDLLQPAVFFRRQVALEVGPLREDLHLVLDTELWWRISERHAFHYLPAVLAIQQRQPDSKTLRLTRRIYEEKRSVFAPVLRRAPPFTRIRHWFGRRLAMGRRWLGLAQSAGPGQRQPAREFLGLSLAENPCLLLAPSWWKACLFTQFGRPSKC
jgi:glycosyltransferase involved in cell wall biosynthesis